MRIMPKIRSIISRKPVKMGNSYYISIPKEWLEENPAEQYFIIVGEDLIILNPKKEIKIK